MKIAEWKNEDWSKGISAQGHLPVGGLFQQMKNVDPFYNQGLAVPSFTPDTITTSTAPKYLTNFNSSGTAYLYWHSDTEIKQILKDSPYTQTDKTSQITFSSTYPVIGATVWQGVSDTAKRYIYVNARGSSGSEIRANTIPISGTDVPIKTGLNNTGMDNIPLCVGADGNLYHGDNSRVGTLVTNQSTSGNSNFFGIDGDFFVRDLINDGTYLVILADNNAEAIANRVPGNYRCKIYFWDMKKSLADYVYEIPDSYLIAGKKLDGNIYFFSYTGFWVCNAGTAPRMIRPLTGYNGTSNAKPKNCYQVVSTKNSIYWVDGFNDSLTNGNIYAYGNPTTGQPKIFYNPHINSNTGNTQNVLQLAGETFWIGTAEPKIFVQNTGSTKGTTTITTIDKTMPETYTFEYVKVVLSAPLSSGQSVSCQVYGADGAKIISDTETKSYSASNPRQILKFKTKPASESQLKFEDFRVTLTTVGASIQRVAVYATPLGDNNEDL